MESVSPNVLDLARDARRITVLTGAGMSAESGISTYRDAQSGLWENHDPMELATPEAWDADPEKVWAWYRWRMSLMGRVEPNPGHEALAAWGERPETDVWIVTQNVDDLHERAGSGVLAHLHGSIFDLRCADCAAPADDPGPELAEPVERLTPPVCGVCGGYIRPGIVLFGENLPVDAFEHAEASVRSSDLVLVVGTSGLVHPAASLPYAALAEGIPVVELNPEDTDFSPSATHVWRARSGQALPALLEALDG